MLAKLQAAFPQLTYKAGERYYYSPQTKVIMYDAARSDANADWSLLHETGHALLGHADYQADVELLTMERAAWDKAQQLAVEFGAIISDDHIEDCLDTYRDWLHRRSRCPTCNTIALQESDCVQYRCFNCHKTWRVTASRFCRSYRRATVVV